MRRARGFTLIELVIVTIVIGIMGAAMTPLIVSSVRAYGANLGDVVVLDKLRYATERLAREIREVQYDAVSGNFAFTGLGANSMVFTRNFFDGIGTNAPSSVSICTTATAVTLAYASSCDSNLVLTDELNGATGLVFTYFDANGNVLTVATTPALSASTVRAVGISLTLRHNNNNYQQATRVELKNMVN